MNKMLKRILKATSCINNDAVISTEDYRIHAEIDATQAVREANRLKTPKTYIINDSTKDLGNIGFSMMGYHR